MAPISVGARSDSVVRGTDHNENIVSKTGWQKRLFRTDAGRIVGIWIPKFGAAGRAHMTRSQLSMSIQAGDNPADQPNSLSIAMPTALTLQAGRTTQGRLARRVSGGTHGRRLRNPRNLAMIRWPLVVSLVRSPRVAHPLGRCSCFRLRGPSALWSSSPSVPYPAADRTAFRSLRAPPISGRPSLPNSAGVTKRKRGDNHATRRRGSQARTTRKKKHGQRNETKSPARGHLQQHNGRAGCTLLGSPPNQFSRPREETATCANCSTKVWR